MYHLTRPSCKVEKWIKEGWDLLDNQEQAAVEGRINSVFDEGFPLDLKHDKVIYLYIFTLLTHLEVIALQLPMRVLPHLKNESLKKCMREQLVDEVFHALLFARMSFALTVPYSHLPEHNQCIEDFRTFINEEKDVGAAIVLINFVAESLFEELLDVLTEMNVAPKIFDVILADERRHVKEAELYNEIGLPSKAYLRKKISHLESELLCDLFIQQKYTLAMVHLLGKSGSIDLMNRMVFKHDQQLTKLEIEHDPRWLEFIKIYSSYLQEIEDYNFDDPEVIPSSTRRIMLGAWRMPVDPTMFSMLTLNVTRLETFEGKYPAQTLTGLILQTMSKLSQENPKLRNYVSHNKIYNMNDNYINLVINLPGSTNHLAMIRFKEPHEVSLYELSESVQNYIEIMSYARYKAEELAEATPKLLEDFYSATIPDPNDIFKEILFPHAIFTLTNVGPWGGEQNLSPLLPFEVLKITMSQVERRQVWNNQIKAFEIQDRLPLSLSADHRVFDANMGTPKMLQIALDALIDKFENNLSGTTSDAIKYVDLDQFVAFSNKMLEQNLDLGFRFLMGTSHCWQSDIDLDLLHEKVNQVTSSVS